MLSEATGINDSGQIVGTSFDANGNSRVFLWQEGTLYDLRVLLPPDSALFPLASGDINDRGEITGVACVVSGGVCSTILHASVAILAPGTARDAAAGSAALATRPWVPAEVRAQVAPERRFGRAVR